MSPSLTYATALFALLPVYSACDSAMGDPDCQGAKCDLLESTDSAGDDSLCAPLEAIFGTPSPTAPTVLFNILGNPALTAVTPEGPAAFEVLPGGYSAIHTLDCDEEGGVADLLLRDTHVSRGTEAVGSTETTSTTMEILWRFTRTDDGMRFDSTTLKSGESPSFEGPSHHVSFGEDFVKLALVFDDRETPGQETCGFPCVLEGASTYQLVDGALQLSVGTSITPILPDGSLGPAQERPAQVAQTTDIEAAYANFEPSSPSP